MSALCSWSRPLTLTVPVPTQEYKWVPANLILGVACDGLASHPGWRRNTPIDFMLQKLGQDPASLATRLVCRTLL